MTIRGYWLFLGLQSLFIADGLTWEGKSKDIQYNAWLRIALTCKVLRSILGAKGQQNTPWGIAPYCATLFISALRIVLESSETHAPVQSILVLEKTVRRMWIAHVFYVIKKPTIPTIPGTSVARQGLRLGADEDDVETFHLEQHLR